MTSVNLIGVVNLLTQSKSRVSNHLRSCFVLRDSESAKVGTSLTLPLNNYSRKKHMSNLVNRENSLLASFLYIDDIGANKDDVFVIDSNIFTSAYRRAVANKINDETQTDQNYGFLSVTLEDETANTKFEQEWIDILSQTPMPLTVAKRMNEKLCTEHKERIAKAFR